MKKILIMIYCLIFSISLFAKECTGSLMGDMERCIKLNLMFKNCREKYNETGDEKFLETGMYARMLSSYAVEHILKNHKEELTEKEKEDMTVYFLTYVDDYMTIGRYINFTSEQLAELSKETEKNYAETVEKLKI